MSGIKVSEPDTNIDAQSLEKRRAYMKWSDYIVDFALHIKAIHLKEIKKKREKDNWESMQSTREALFN